MDRRSPKFHNSVCYHVTNLGTLLYPFVCAGRKFIAVGLDSCHITLYMQPNTKSVLVQHRHNNKTYIYYIHVYIIYTCIFVCCITLRYIEGIK